MIERGHIRSRVVTHADRQLIARGERHPFLTGFRKALRRGRENLTKNSSNFSGVIRQLGEHGFFFTDAERSIAGDMLSIIVAENLLGTNGRENQTNDGLGYKKTITEAELRIDDSLNRLPQFEQERALAMMPDLRESVDSFIHSLTGGDGEGPVTFLQGQFSLPELLRMIAMARKNRFGRGN